jgi:hypothetical protein
MPSDGSDPFVSSGPARSSGSALTFDELTPVRLSRTPDGVGEGYWPQKFAPEHELRAAGVNESQCAAPQLESFVHGSAQNSFPCESCTQQLFEPPVQLTDPLQQS